MWPFGISQTLVGPEGRYCGLKSSKLDRVSQHSKRQHDLILFSRNGLHREKSPSEFYGASRSSTKLIALWSTVQLRCGKALQLPSFQVLRFKLPILSKAFQQIPRYWSEIPYDHLEIFQLLIPVSQQGRDLDDSATPPSRSVRRSPTPAYPYAVQ